MQGESGHAQARDGWAHRWTRSRTWLQRHGGWLLLVLLAWWALARLPWADWLLPGDSADALVRRGKQALQVGVLDRTDGSGARQLFEAALARDPDRADARAGLAAVARAALAAADAALARQRLDDAARLLALARALQAPRAGTDAVALRLRRAEAARTNLDAWQQQASAAFAAGRLDGAADAALPLLSAILRLDPARDAALDLRERTVAALLARARARLQTPRADAAGLRAAAADIRSARAADPAHVDLPDTEAAFTAALDRQLATAEHALRGDQLDRAEIAFAGVLALRPHQRRAESGLVEVAAAHIGRAQAWLRSGNDRAHRDAAARELAAARRLAADDPRLAETQRRLRLAGASARRDARASAARLPALLAAAETAAAAGHWLLPPGESVYDALRRAEAIAPHDPRVHALRRRLGPQLSACFARSLEANRVLAAETCVLAWQQFAPNDAAVASARTRLAERWLAVGDERLGADDLAFAREAYQHAQRLDPRVAGLARYARRLKAAEAARPR